MNTNEIIPLRLRNLLLSGNRFSTPGETVAWLGALQAQDYHGAKWALGLRLPGFCDRNIEEAIANKSIVRSWSLRGTLHIMAPQDIRWMTGLVALRLFSMHAANIRREGLDTKTLGKCYRVLQRELEGGRSLSRSEIMDTLNRNRIKTAGLASNFIMLCAALEGVICLGSRRGKEFTYTLLDEWLPPARVPVSGRSEALSMLARRYFLSHGPATLKDFVWWSGLTVADSKMALDNIKGDMDVIAYEGQELYYFEDGSDAELKPGAAFLLPGFDEYVIGYRDREHVLPPEHAAKVIGAGNGIFAPTVLLKGRVAGTWKRTITKNNVEMAVKTFGEIKKAEKTGIARSIKSYGSFLELPVKDV